MFERPAYVLAANMDPYRVTARLISTVCSPSIEDATDEQLDILTRMMSEQ